MKRALLIAGGTIGGLGAVLSITPPQINSGSTLAIPDAKISAKPAPTVTVTATPSASTSKKATTATKKATAKATPAQTQSQNQTSGGGVSGSFTGDPVDVGYGIVQVKITVSNGKITEAQAIQAPTGRNAQWTQRAVPSLRQQTIAANGSNIQGVSGASYTSYGWYTSLVAALKKAGMQ